MTYFQAEHFQASGSQLGITGGGSLWVLKRIFFSTEQQYEQFPGLLQIIPESGVKFSRSGCTFESGTYQYSY